MKRRIYILAVIIAFCMLLISCGEKENKIKINKSCNLRQKPSIESKVLGSAPSGMYFDILDTTPAYLHVTIVDIKTSKSMTGWMWIGILKKTDGVYEVIDKGGTLRKVPKKGDNIVGYVFPGSKVKQILDEKPLRYKIKVGNTVGWISACYATKIK